MSYRDEIDKNHGQPWRRKPVSLAQVIGHPWRSLSWRNSFSRITHDLRARDCRISGSLQISSI